MFTVKAMQYDGSGGLMAKGFEAQSYQVIRKVEGGDQQIVVSLVCPHVDDGDDQGKSSQYVHLDVTKTDITKQKIDGGRCHTWHEVYIENAEGKTVEAVKYM